MRITIGTKINGLSILILLLILLNVGVAIYDFNQISQDTNLLYEKSDEFKSLIGPVISPDSEAGTVLEEASSTFKSIATAIDKRKNSSIRIQFILLLITIVVALVASYILGRQISRPLKETVENLHFIADGDLTHEDIKIITDDEVRDMTVAMNEMKNDLIYTFGRVLKTGLQLEEASHETAESTHRTSDSAKNIARGALSQADSVHNASESMHAMSETIKTVINNTQQALQSARTVNKQAQDGEVAIKKTVEAMTQIEESSGKIEAIVSVITDITNQTNLLSLNAAIEAAKAGDMGKGFAVVADEVRRLAERSQGATQEIFDLITESTERVSNGTLLVESTGNTLHEIIVGVQKTTGMIDAISEAISGHRTKFSHVEDTLETLDRISQETVKSTSELSETSAELEETTQDLEKAAVRLHKVIGQFKLPEEIGDKIAHEVKEGISTTKLPLPSHQMNEVEKGGDALES